MKIALCIPVHGNPAKQFMVSLLEMVLHTSRERPDIELKPIVTSSSVLTVARHSLVKAALKWEADYLLCLDSDHVFPERSLLRLLSHDLEVVGCNYRRRKAPYHFTAIGQGGVVSTTKDSPETEEVHHIGMGLVLIRADAIRRLTPLFPMFAFTEGSDGYADGEDFYFFRRLHKAGVRIHVDHALSMEVGHVTEGVIFPGSRVD